jgi:hypothetical protein
MINVRKILDATQMCAKDPGHDLYLSVSVGESDQVWCADVTFPIRRGFLYLVARRIQWALHSGDNHKGTTDCRRERSVTEAPRMIWIKCSDYV